MLKFRISKTFFGHVISHKILAIRQNFQLSMQYVCGVIGENFRLYLHPRIAWATENFGQKRPTKWTLLFEIYYGFYKYFLLKMLLKISVSFHLMTDISSINIYLFHKIRMILYLFKGKVYEDKSKVVLSLSLDMELFENRSESKLRHISRCFSA